jgi:hypothetical protein
MRVFNHDRRSPGDAMIAGARYGHTNLVALDWRALSRFYQGKQLTWVYVTDPEGNILEIQSRPK